MYYQEYKIRKYLSMQTTWTSTKEHVLMHPHIKKSLIYKILEIAHLGRSLVTQTH